MKIVITGGHHTGALPVISEIRNKHPQDKLFWFGHRHAIKGDKNDTLEYKDITGLNIPFYDLKAGKLYRNWNPINLLKIPLGVLQSFYLLIKVKPDIILSFGGYLAAPVVFSAWVLGIPSITHEQTVVTGYANKFISKFAKKILLTWEESKKHFKGKKTKVVGIPLRPEIFSSSTDNFKLNSELPTVYITAGKTGSHIINEVVLAALPNLLGVCNVIHQCGDSSMFDDYSLLREEYKQLITPGIYNLRKFVREDEIGEAFTKSDLVVGRSGAHTIYELLALEKPALLIPIPWASHNEQFENAVLLKDVGLVNILEQKDLTPQTLYKAIKTILLNLNNLSLSDISLKNSLVRNSAELIVSELYETKNR